MEKLRRGYPIKIGIESWGYMQHADDVSAKFLGLFHFMRQKLLAHELIERFIKESVIRRKQSLIYRAVITVIQMSIDFPSVSATFCNAYIVPRI